MKRYHTLAVREILDQKMTSFLILTAMILSAMMTAAAGQSAGVLAAMREQQAIAIGGNRYATFVQLTEEQARFLEQDPRLSYTGRFIALGKQELNNQLSLDLTEYWGEGLQAHPTYTRMAAGRLPEAPMELALPEDALQFLGFSGEIGDTIRLSCSKALRHGATLDAYDYTAEFTLVGVMESNFLGYTSGSILGLAGEGTAAAILPAEYLYYNVDIRTAEKKDFQVVVDALRAQLELHELDTIYQIPLLNALGIRYDLKAAGSDMAVDDSGFSWLLAAGVLAVALFLLAAGLVIYNIMKIAVSRRIRQYGVLRAIGGEKGQLYAVVSAEVLLLCTVGIPVGLLLGLLSAGGILNAALSQLPPGMFLAQDAEQLKTMVDANSGGQWRALLLSAAVTLAFAFLAAAPAVRFAAKVSPVAAMSGANLQVKRRRGRTKKIRNFERYYAWLNLCRSRGRTVITILSLVMSVTVFIALQGVLSLLSVSGSVPEHLGDYSVVNQVTGIPKEELAALEADERVAFVAAEQFSFYELDGEYAPAGIETNLVLGPGENFQIFGFNDAWMDYEFAQRLSDGELAALKAGEGCVVRNPIPMEFDGVSFGTTCIEEGSVVIVAGRELPVLLSLSGYDSYFSVGNSGFINGVQALVSDRLYPLLTGTDVYAELRPALAEDTDRTAFDGVLEQLCQRVPGATAVSYEETDRQVEESAAQINMLAWGLILLIGLIGILNIINTVYTNIHTRIAETGVQRAVGMSVRSLYRTFLWEGAYYGLIAAAVGCIAGYVCTVLMEAAAAETLRLVFPPLLPMAEAVTLSVAACLLATAIPMGKIAKLSIVDAIEETSL